MCQDPLYQIIGIFLLSLVLRLTNLGNYPVGLHVDEVKVGWNALSILNTLRDDHGSLLPLYYNTFGDFRPTGIFYLSIPSLLIFGNTVFAIRLTSALIGALTILPVFLICKLVFTKEGARIGLFSSLILAVSPWHIEVSRATSEVVISTFFALFAIYFLIKLIKTNQNKFIYFTLGSILVSYLLYHSARMLVPLYLIATIFFYIKEINKKHLIPVVFSILLTLVISFSNQSRERLKQVSIFNSENVKFELQQSKDSKLIVYTRSIVKEYGKYFSSDFLIGESAKPYRYLTLGVGLLNYIDLFLLGIGIYLIINKKNNILILIFLLLSPLAAILTFEDSPNLHRAFYMVIFIAIIEGYAFYTLKNTKIIFVILGISLIYFLYSYFVKSDMHIPYQKNLYIDSPTYRNIGNSELARKIEVYKTEYDLIYVTNFPDNLYPWYAFLNKKDPKEFNAKSLILDSNERRFENIIFTDTKCPSDYAFSNLTSIEKILVIDSSECPTESKIKDGLDANLIDEIKRSNDSTVFALFGRSN